MKARSTDSSPKDPSTPNLAAQDPTLLLLAERAGVPAISIGGLLCFAILFVPGYVRPELWARGLVVLTGLAVLAISILIKLRGLSSKLLFGIAFVANIVIALFSSTLTAGQATASLAVYFGIPTLLVAMYCGRRYLVWQMFAAGVGLGLLFYLQGFPVGVIIPQLIGAVFAIGSPALAVMYLRERLAAQVMMAQEAAVTDPLTRTVNRRGLEAQVPLLSEHAQHWDHVIAVAVLDVDHFKQINDTMGHAHGDQVLMKIAETLRNNVRSSDILARLGGEEFALIAAMPQEHVSLFGERLRRDVAGAFEAGGPTVSVGVVACYAPANAPDTAAKIWSLIDEADELMYEAKRSGRNQVHTRLVGTSEIVVTPDAAVAS